MPPVSNANHYKPLPLFLVYVLLPPLVVVVIGQIIGLYLGWATNALIVITLLAAMEYGEIRKQSGAPRMSYAYFSRTTRGKVAYFLSVAVFLLFVSIPDMMVYFAGLRGLTFIALVVMSIVLGWLAVRLVIQLVTPLELKRALISQSFRS